MASSDQKPLRHLGGPGDVEGSRELRTTLMTGEPDILANTRRCANVDLMLVQPRRRWANINSTLAQCLVFCGIGDVRLSRFLLKLSADGMPELRILYMRKEKYPN